MDRRITFEILGQGLEMLFLNFRTQLTEAQAKLYWCVLQDMPADAFRLAVKRALREAKYLPRPAELLDLAGMSETAESRAVAAWSDVQRAQPLGGYKHIDFADALVNAAIRSLGGWPAFLERWRDAESEKWLRHEFLKTYQALANGTVSADACAPLPGLAQITAIGGEVQPCVPVRIECTPERAALPNFASRTSGRIAGQSGEPQRVPDLLLEVQG